MLPRSTPVFATGVSSGCTTAMLITVLNQDIRSFSGGACTSPLSYLREFYRIINHPNQWDFPEFEDELPLLALGASKNFQFQIGTRDVLYPNGEKWVTDSKQIITQRDILVSELAGLILGAQKIFTKSNLGGSVNLAAHNLGHTLIQKFHLSFLKIKKIMPRHLIVKNNFLLARKITFNSIYSSFDVFQEFAYDIRKNPSPRFPKLTPASVATPAFSSNSHCNFKELLPVLNILGKA